MFSRCKLKHFSILFDRTYAAKGLATIDSLLAVCPDAKIHALALDELTASALQSLRPDSVKIWRLSDIENEEILVAKGNRSWSEYCWTLSSVFTHHVMEAEKDVELITYIDSDLFFYDRVDPLFDEAASASIVIVGHNFPPRLKHLEKFGKYFLHIKNASL